MGSEMCIRDSAKHDEHLKKRDLPIDPRLGDVTLSLVRKGLTHVLRVTDLVVVHHMPDDELCLEQDLEKNPVSLRKILSETVHTRLYDEPLEICLSQGSSPDS